MDRVPVWLMRQAGRYMPEYQALRAKAGGFHELCLKPEYAAQATLDAARILDTDAAIIFSDITLPGEAMGLPLTFDPGPKFAHGLRSPAELAPIENKLSYVYEAIALTRKQLDPSVSLIGFVGAPFTLAAYMIEGVPTKSWLATKRMAYSDAHTMHGILEKVAAAVTEHARKQVEAGCDAIQLFDTSAGMLSAHELHGFAFAYAKTVIQALKPLGVPVIYFARDIGAHLREAAKLGADVLGIDWTVNMRDVRDLPCAVMGNLDPGILFTNPETVRDRVHAIMNEMRGRNGFVFNLGHGVLPETPVENVKAVIQAVRD